MHWEDWPFDSPRVKSRGFAQGKPKQDKKLEAEMKLVRDFVTKALAERAKAGIKVRQPLASLAIKGNGREIRKDLLILLKDEVNVKEIVFDQKLKNEVELDTMLSPELREEGSVREILRSIQEMRKEAGYKPQDKIRVWYRGPMSVEALLSKHENFIKKAAGITTIVQGDAPQADAAKEIDLDGENIKFSIKL